MKSDKFFKEINIWKSVDERTVARYRCFEILPDGKFFVQSKDHIYEDSDKVYRENLEMYFVESLSSENFDEMSAEACSTIEEAITKHEADFTELENEVMELSKKKFK
ncbi:MAG: hypothetical protein M3T96_00430 [Acidobacteriota bacterium]|nr:hypothetical protein [Acidobacteriota bacterium]